MSGLAPAPTRVVRIDHGDPIPELSGTDPVTGRPYRCARLFVWDDDRLIGSIDVDLESSAPSEEVLDRVDELVHDARAVHVANRRPSAAPVDAGDATVVVATRHRPDSLIRCLDSILTSTGRGPQVLVVDSAPDDERALRALRGRFSEDERVRYLRADRPGLAVAHNLAIPHVTTDIVLFTDDDVVVDRRWVAATLATFAEVPRSACVTGRILPAELSTQAQCLIEASAGFDKGSERRVFDRDEHRPDDPLFPFTAGSFGSGANMAFRTEYLRSVGGFDEVLGAGARGRGGDDLAAFIDVVARGLRLVYEPSAVVFHHHHREPAALRAQAGGYGAGFSAAIVSTISRHPVLVVELARRLPAAVRYALSADSPKNARRPDSYPRSLHRLELLGMLRGPFSYLRGRWDARVTSPRAAVGPVSVGDRAWSAALAGPRTSSAGAA